MDVSAVIREVERQPTVVAATRSAAAATPEGHTQTPDQRAASLPPRPRGDRTIDPTEGLAERAGAGFARAEGRDAAAAVDAAAPAEELWIPAWVRLQYAARARKGWFLPAPSTLAGYGEEDEPGR